MKKRHELIPSQALGRSVHMWCYGHWGVPLLAFPSAAGMAHEWDAHGMVDTLGDLIEEGRLKLYCVESNVAEAWTQHHRPAEWRIRRHMAYEAFVMQELVPWIRYDCRSAETRIATAGCSLGGFYSANFGLKFPEIFHWALCMSGRYNIDHFTGGFTNLDTYFNNPIAYTSNLEGAHLERVRQYAHLLLVCGQGPYEEGCIDETNELADILAAKGVSHQRDIWGHDVAHDWNWWRRQLRYHVVRAFGA